MIVLQKIIKNWNTIYDIEKDVFQELEVAPYWHVKQMAEELYIEEMFIGLK